MSDPNSGPAAEIVTYGIGYVTALVLTVCSFALVHWAPFNAATTLGTILGLALLQVVVHFRCFLHVSLRKSAREDLQLIMFSTLIIALMVAGTSVVLLNLRHRMM
ncbi:MULTISPECIES: cytochrome o ubiquinol/quinol oxidase subunit IV [unclassified Sphingobium]|uniref:cytochrome o ubiquinol oxidase subunit IV n=1 Tax=unclassified Sphingobium TaxID=2611147 RepID=UPI000D176F72|nr:MULTISPECIES: cytochrome C oxidase subunit IV family protein [unclassified Sphingobium]MBG6119850.1 cytochrome o ubiquinol oxidase operon protein cyoD [Sphingobium sp. JAI105]PSO10193.1 cytochrome-c oxidase [Sphingobium sp. AEW4]TWC98950.1 cytochrome o ubiquinol oxidase operon protein cyoD [Sphingobium sp. AEW010]TWD18491.1 cytochrome o ubiquinol oxidase operon protein cyoD [Sphingobium sp. AEW013]TWD21237.1 cytochrome o ubiquinol oxidase operon protein cyoD [Sphingobium sp. AEW001]